MCTSLDEHNAVDLQIGLLYAIGAKFSSENSLKILSLLRILKEGPARAYQVCWNCGASQGMGPSFEVNSFQGTLPFSPGLPLASLESPVLNCTRQLLMPISATTDMRFETTVVTPLAILVREANVPSLSELKGVQSLI